MAFKTLLAFTFAILSFFDSAAFARASAAASTTPDPAVVTSPINGNAVEKNQAAGFLNKVSGKVSGWFKTLFAEAPKKTSAKRAFGVASAVLASIGLITLFSGAGVATLYFFAAGILAGITSLVLPADRGESSSAGKTGPTKTRTGTGLAIVGILIPVVLLIAIIIAFSTAKWH